MYYTIIFVLLFIISLRYLNKSETLSKGHLFILFLFFWLVAGLSYETGVDWRVYDFMYSKCYPLNKVFQYKNFYSIYGIVLEPGYSFLCSFFKFIHFDFWCFKIIISFITSIFFFKALLRYTKQYYFVLLIYFGFIYLTLNMSGIRQALALSIVFYSIQYIKTRNFKYFLLFILLASTIHLSSLIMLPMYFILNRKISSMSIYIWLLLGFIIQVFKISIVREVVVNMASFFNSPFIVKLLLYSSKEATKNTFSFSFLAIILIFIILVINRTKLNSYSYSNLFLNLYFFYICIYEYLWDTNDLKVRLSWFFALGMIIIVPEYIMLYHRIGNKIILFLFIAFLSFYESNFIFLERENGIAYNPYQSYITYKLFDVISTGKERLNEFSKNIK